LLGVFSEGLNKDNRCEQGNADDGKDDAADSNHKLVTNGEISTCGIIEQIIFAFSIAGMLLFSRGHLIT
jgi:hypothetical protein